MCILTPLDVLIPKQYTSAAGYSKAEYVSIPGIKMKMKAKMLMLQAEQNPKEERKLKRKSTVIGIVRICKVPVRLKKNADELISVSFQL